MINFGNFNDTSEVYLQKYEVNMSKKGPIYQALQKKIAESKKGVTVTLSDGTNLHVMHDVITAEEIMRTSAVISPRYSGEYPKIVDQFNGALKDPSFSSKIIKIIIAKFDDEMQLLSPALKEEPLPFIKKKEFFNLLRYRVNVYHFLLKSVVDTDKNEDLRSILLGRFNEDLLLAICNIVTIWIENEAPFGENLAFFEFLEDCQVYEELLLEIEKAFTLVLQENKTKHTAKTTERIQKNIWKDGTSLIQTYVNQACLSYMLGANGKGLKLLNKSKSLLTLLRQYKSRIIEFSDVTPEEVENTLHKALVATITRTEEEFKDKIDPYLNIGFQTIIRVKRIKESFLAKYRQLRQPEKSSSHSPAEFEEFQARIARAITLVSHHNFDFLEIAVNQLYLAFAELSKLTNLTSKDAKSLLEPIYQLMLNVVMIARQSNSVAGKIIFEELQQLAKNTVETSIALNELTKKSETELILATMIVECMKLPARLQHPDYTSVYEKHKRYLDDSKLVESVLNGFIKFLAADADDLIKKQQETPQCYQSRKEHVHSLIKRINAIHFFLENVAPKHDNLKELKYRLLNFICDDIKSLTHNLILMVEDPQISTSEKEEYKNYITGINPIQNKYLAEYRAIVDELMGSSKPHYLTENIYIVAKKHVWHAYNTFVCSSANSAYLNFLFKDETNGKQALNQGMKFISFLKKHKAKMIALGNLDTGSANTHIKDVLEHSLDRAKHTWQQFDEEQAKIKTIKVEPQPSMPEPQVKTESITVIQKPTPSPGEATLTRLTRRERKERRKLKTEKKLQEKLARHTRYPITEVAVHTETAVVSEQSKVEDEVKIATQDTVEAQHLESSMALLEQKLATLSISESIESEHDERSKTKSPTPEDEKNAAAMASLVIAEQLIEQEKSAKRSEAAMGAEALVTEMSELSLATKPAETTSDGEQQIPTGKKINITSEEADILSKLIQQGYWAYIVGGQVRDQLLGLEPNDTDIITNCPKDTLAQIIGKPCTANIHRADLFQVGDNIDIVCTEKSLIEELKSRDISINTYIANADGDVFAPLNNFEDINAPYLIVLGKTFLRILEDPSRIFRLIRYSTHVHKELSLDDITAIQVLAHNLIRMPFGVYAKQLSTLFLRGKAVANLHSIVSKGVLPFLHPSAGPKPIFFDLRIYYSFLINKMSELDAIALQDKIKHFSSYHLIALFLLPEIINLSQQSTIDLDKSISSTLDFYCQNYIGEFKVEDKSCFMLAVSSHLKQYFLEYLSYQAFMNQSIELYTRHYRVQQQVPLMQPSQSSGHPRAPITTQFDSKKRPTASQPRALQLGDFISAKKEYKK